MVSPDDTVVEGVGMMPFGRGGRGLDGLRDGGRVGVGMWREQPYNMIHMLIAFSGHSHSPFGDGAGGYQFKTTCAY